MCRQRARIPPMNNRCRAVYLKPEICKASREACILSIPQSIVASTAHDRWELRRSYHCQSQSIHVPAVADDDRLACQSIGLETGQQQGDLSDVLDHRELFVDGLAQHQLLHDALFGDAELLGLLRDLFLYEGRH